MDTPEQQDRDDLHDWGHNQELINEYYESERLRREAEAEKSDPQFIDRES